MFVSKRWLWCLPTCMPKKHGRQKILSGLHLKHLKGLEYSSDSLHCNYVRNYPKKVATSIFMKLYQSPNSSGPFREQPNILSQRAHVKPPNVIFNKKFSSCLNPFCVHCSTCLLKTHYIIPEKGIQIYHIPSITNSSPRCSMNVAHGKIS